MRRELVEYAGAQHGASLRMACRTVGISDTVYRYRPDPHRDDKVIAKLQEAVGRYPAYGFDKLFKILRRWGHPWNHKRVYRLYCSPGLNKRRRGKKRLPSRHPEPLAVPAQANHCKSMDFMSDSLFCGRRFRAFNLVDDFNRETLAIEIDLNLPAPRVIRVLERFNRTYRDEILNMYVFRILTEVRELPENRVREYNEERPHDALGDLSPWEYRDMHEQLENSSLGCH